MIRVLALAAALIAAALLGATDGAAVRSQTPKLFGTVGPAFSIVLRDAQGNRVTKVDPGTYSVEVDDLSDAHNFHLTGPGVDERTGVEGTGTTSWTVTFTDAVYRYFCDPHASTMNGAFTAGNPPPPTPPPSGGVVTAKSKLVLTSGPGFVISLKTSAGKSVKRMKLGTYTVIVRDRGSNHNAHVIAPGFNRKTTPLTYTGTKSWKVKLGKAGTLRFLCDPHALAGMRGSAKIVR
ncbi:MAG: hypothetical protein ACRDPV_00770 [Gaiellaceae bacterium]